MKKIFISIFIVLMPLFVYIILLRKVNGKDGYIYIERIAKYIETFDGFSSFESVIEYFKAMFKDLSSVFNEIQSIKIDGFFDVLEKGIKYIVLFIQCLVSFLMGGFNAVFRVFEFMYTLIEFLLGFFSMILS